MGKMRHESDSILRIRFESTRAAQEGRELALAADNILAEWQAWANGADVVWKDSRGVVVRRTTAEDSGGVVWHQHPINLDGRQYGTINVRGPMLFRTHAGDAASLTARTALLTVELHRWAHTEAERRGEKIQRLLEQGFTEEVALLFELCGLPRKTGPLHIAVIEMAGGTPFQEMDRLRDFLIPYLWAYRPTFPFVGYTPNGLAALIPVAAVPDLSRQLNTWLDAWHELYPETPARSAIVRAEGLPAARDALQRGYATVAAGAWLGRWGLLPETFGDAVAQMFVAMGPDRLADFVRSTLRDLLRFEHNELLQTLWVYLEADHALHHAAERLHVHRNTLLYRLHQIERLTGRSLHHTPDVTALWLALQGWAWLRTVDPSHSPFF
jgi:hypothetical protein